MPEAGGAGTPRHHARARPDSCGDGRVGARQGAEGELLHLTTAANERGTIPDRLHALESRLNPRRFVRLGRGTQAAVDQIQKVSPMPGGTYQVQMSNGQTLPVSRIQSRILRDTLLRI